LLSDERSAVRELYGVPKVLGMIPGRVTYVIDRNGVVRHITSSLLSYKHHIDEAIETLTSLNRNE
jgi:peroxiredoxin Q/BCP